MQSGKKATESIKESAANAAATAKASMEKAKATAKEKTERLTTRDPLEKQAATMEKERRQTYAELNKDEAKAHNEAARRLAETGEPHPGYKTWGTEQTGTGGRQPHTVSTVTEDIYQQPAASVGNTDPHNPRGDLPPSH